MPNIKTIAIIGAGPAGLMATEKLAAAGFGITLYDRMGTPARKFLRAGHGGLNLTNALAPQDFPARYGAAADFLTPALREFAPQDVIHWCEDLGIPTFVGTSGRVFPNCMKASPLLRAWREKLQKAGVTFVLGARWQGWTEEDALVFTTAEGQSLTQKPDATLLALGGASWPQLGSDAAWTDFLRKEAVAIAPFRASNCGFAVPWSEVFQTRFAGQPIKPVTVTFGGVAVQGELMITRYGIEGGPVYALSSALRDAIEKEGAALLHLNLRHGFSHAALTNLFSKPRGSQSLPNYLRKAGGLSPVAIGLIQEHLHTGGRMSETPADWATLVQAFPLRLTDTGPLSRAISSAGGIKLDEVDAHFELKKKRGVFVAGEMLDWDAPTGGFLLQACFSTGVAAAKGIIRSFEG